MMPYKLLAKFEATFRDGPYRHRNANLGNRIADFLYEDMVDVDPASKFATRAASGARVLNPAIVVPGIRARRGDGSFGAPIPQTQARYEPGFNVARGATATVEVGAEVKIVAKAMGKQIDRVINDLRHQVVEFRQKSDRCLTVGIVGVNFSDHYISYEGARTFPTGPGHRAPSSEAPIAERRLATEVAGDYDEFLLLGFKTSNEPPYPFEWLALANKERSTAPCWFDCSKPTIVASERLPQPAHTRTRSSDCIPSSRGQGAQASAARVSGDSPTPVMRSDPAP